MDAPMDEISCSCPAICTHEKSSAQLSTANLTTHNSLYGSSVRIYIELNHDWWPFLNPFPVVITVAIWNHFSPTIHPIYCIVGIPRSLPWLSWLLTIIPLLAITDRKYPDNIHVVSHCQPAMYHCKPIAIQPTMNIIESFTAFFHQFVKHYQPAATSYQPVIPITIINHHFTVSLPSTNHQLYKYNHHQRWWTF